VSRSHPPTLLTLARRLVREAKLWARGDRVLVAVSGGGDSMALLHVAARLRRELGHRVFAHGVDHGLRPEAEAELDLAEGVARSLDVPMTRSRLRVAKGGNLQARARDARREALCEEAARVDAKVIATGHHADDRAETILLRLLRGAGPRGVAALPPRTDEWVRPLLSARKSDILAHLSRNGLPSASDPSNADPRFLRVRVRRELLPLLEELSPGIVGHLTALADQLAALLPSEVIGEDFGGYTPGNSVPYPPGTPRASRDAIARLKETKSAKTRVLLPKGLVALYDRDQLSLIVRPRSTQEVVRWKKR
jgi:tRNA(Ile)-lysidine synthase